MGKGEESIGKGRSWLWEGGKVGLGWRWEDWGEGNQAEEGRKGWEGKGGMGGEGERRMGREKSPRELKSRFEGSG